MNAAGAPKSTWPSSWDDEAPKQVDAYRYGSLGVDPSVNAWDTVAMSNYGVSGFSVKNCSPSAIGFLLGLRDLTVGKRSASSHLLVFLGANLSQLIQFIGETASARLSANFTSTKVRAQSLLGLHSGPIAQMANCQLVPRAGRQGADDDTECIILSW